MHDQCSYRRVFFYYIVHWRDRQHPADCDFSRSFPAHFMIEFIHSGQLKDFSDLWALICLKRLPFLMLLWHTSHLTVSSPKCVNMCLVRALLNLKVFVQIEQGNSIAGVVFRTTICEILFRWLADFGHCSETFKQLLLSSVEFLCSWFSVSLFLVTEPEMLSSREFQRNFPILGFALLTVSERLISLCFLTPGIILHRESASLSLRDFFRSFTASDLVLLSESKK